MVAAVLAISGAMYVSTQRNLPRDPHGTTFLPFLASELNTVSAVSVRRGGPPPNATVHQQNGHWTVAERGDYPADVSKVRKLLLALNDAKIIEEKTSNPASFPLIGVEDPSLPGASGAEISVTAPDGKHAVIIGKPVGEGNFARRVGENTSYIIEPSLSFEVEPRYWIDARLIDIAAGSIQSIEFKPASGSPYVVHRATAAATPTPAATGGAANTAASAAAPSAAGAADPARGAAAADAAAGNFVLDGVPPGRKAADAALLAPSPSTYSGLTADDVAPVADIDFSKATVVTVTLSDGTVITMTGAVIGDKHWLQLKSSKDPALDAKTTGRAFDIAGYRFDALFRPLEQWLVPKEQPPAKKAPGTAATSGSAAHPAPKKQSPASAP
jgi:hypothetical protein